MKTVLIMATTAAMIEQFNKENIVLLKKIGYEVHIAGNWKQGNPISEERLEQFKQWLEENKVRWFHISATRKPTDIINNGNAYKEVLKLIKLYKYQFIHCHTPIGSVIARLAAHKTKIKVIYTAHGFHFYKGAPWINWLVYYPIEKILSKWTDVLILINTEDYDLAKSKFNAKEIYYLPGIGIDINKYMNEYVDTEDKRKELGLQNSEKMLLSVGELIPRKNHEIVIKAISKINKDDIHYFICGKGKKREDLIKLTKDLQLEKQIHFMGYRTDVFSLCKICDGYIFPSFQEGLSVALMEAIAAEIPVICSKIRGNVDLISNDKYLFEPTDVEDIVRKIEFLLIDKHEQQIEININKLRMFDILNVNDTMEKIYNSIQ